MKKLFLSCILTLCFLYSTAQQTEQEKLEFSIEGSLSLQEVFEIIEQGTPYTFSYNPALLPLDKEIIFSGSPLNLEQVLYKISSALSLDFQIDKLNSKILITLGKEISLRGIVYDSLSGESINGATLIAEGSYIGSTNNNGYFNVTIDRSVEKLLFFTLGYLTKEKKISLLEDEVNIIRLSPRTDINVIIRPDADLSLFNNNSISVQEMEYHYGTAGGNDLIQNIKFEPGISPGSEGQNGFSSRGGGPHQNLILIDNMPIYEASHLAGLSSIFLPEAIKSIELYKSDYPARYGGRVSSVLDVRLKDGNRTKYTRNLSVGLEGITAHIDGPLGESTSLNLNARSSWFSEIARPIIRNYTDVSDLSLRYNDFYSKITHWFSRTSKISFSSYWGDDLVRITRDNTNPMNPGFRDINRISWGNKFLSLSWQQLLSNRLNLSVNAGLSSYDYRSRGSFELNYETAEGIASSEFDILSLSKLNDKLLKAELDYYTQGAGRFKLGAELIGHQNSPSITEKAVFSAEEPDVQTRDTTYFATILNLYAENRMEWDSGIKITSGLRLSNYIMEGKTFRFLEPRLSLEYKTGHYLLSLAYARSSQFIHLLSNPGPGLPSELWVPSTERVEPERSQNYSLSLIRRTDGFSLGSALWLRRFSELIEYANSSDIIYSIIIDSELYQLEVDNNNWENRISTGSGLAYGIELWTIFNIGNFNTKLNYTLSRSQRSFNSIDEGEAFPYKYDTPHNISTLLHWQIDDNKSLVLNWQYASGTAYSLYDTERLGPDGQPVLEPSSRNNIRLPAFHHLDIHYRWTKSFDTGDLKADVGLYNVYNRLNAFYEYLSQDREAAPPELVKISIYPILPQFKLSYSW